jgi:O-antigen ligase
MFSLAGLLVYLALEMVRPDILFPSIHEAIMFWVAVATAIIWLIETLVTRNWRAFPSTRFLLAFVAVSTLSTLIAGGDLLGIFDRLFSLGKILLMYLILVQCVHNERRVRIVRWALEGLILWLVIGGVLFVNGHPIRGFSWDVQDRLQYSGIFADPNDLAQAYAILFTLLLYFVVNGYRWYLRIPAAGLLYLTGSAIVFTASRGGVIGVIVGVFLCFRKRMGALVPAIVGGALLLTMTTMGIARMNMLNSDEASAESRLLSWAQGWYMLHSHPVLGVGLQNWERYHHLAAHNSFIQVAAETGTLGLLCWLGFFYFPMEDSLFAILPGHRFESPPFAAAQLQATLVVWFVTSLFLTRNQMLLPYILAGLVIITNHIQFRPEIQGALEAEVPSESHIETQDEFVVEEQPEFESVSRVSVSWADMRHVIVFVIVLLLWWRFMIRGMVPGL